MHTLCILCCYSFQDNPSSSLTEKEEGNKSSGVDRLKGSPQFNQFCQELNADPKLIVSVLEEAASTSQQQLALCSECLASMEAVLTEKLALDQVEGQVARLQRDLLSLMGQLQMQVDRYHARMRKIYEVVQNADVSCLEILINPEKILTRSQGRPKRGRRKKRPESKVFQFRDRIVQVVGDLENFKGDLARKTGASSAPSRNKAIPSSLRRNPSRTSSSDAASTYPGNVGVLKKVEEFEESPYPEDLMEVCEVEIRDTLGETSKGNEEEQDKEGDSSEEVADDSEDSDWSDKDNKLTAKSSKKKKRKKGKNTKKSLPTKKTEHLTDLDTTCWSTFKRRCISRMLRRNKKLARKRPDGSDVSVNVDPTRKNWLSYDPLTDVVTVGGVQVLLVDNPQSSDDPQDPDGFLKCSVCAFESRGGLSVARDIQMEKVIVTHVLGHHLNAFRCPYCDRQMKSHWRYMEHLKSHTGSFDCDICGKPCSTRDSCENHKWLHLSKEEQEEAIRNGAKDPKRHLNKQREAEGDSHMCRFCGREFHTGANLRQHEKTHAENREVIVCPLCGKTLLKESYRIYHKDYGCPALHGAHLDRVHCLVCNTKFKTKQFLARHMRRVHSTAALERLHECTVCSKRFKAAGDLLMHSKIHAEDKLWTCSKGCGKEFSVKRYWRRHELVCRAAGSEEVVATSRGGRVLSPAKHKNNLEIPLSLNF